jgi:hypothetical protein
MRNALIAGVLTGIAFGLAHLGIIPSPVETALYLVAIPLGGYHWGREAIVAIGLLMTGASAEARPPDTNQVIRDGQVVEIADTTVRIRGWAGVYTYRLSPTGVPCMITLLTIRLVH